MIDGKVWLGRIGNEEELTSVGRKFTETDFEITREDRTASGRLVIDVIATKKKFNLSYELVTNTTLEQLNRLYSTGGILSLRTQNNDGSVNHYMVKFRPFTRSRFLAVGEWLWEGISLELEEV